MPFTESQIPFTAQHYLECGIEDCERNCQLYCNDCHQPMCDQCRDEHQRSPKTKNHEVVLFMQHKRRLPEEKCRDHPTKDINIFCDKCSVPLCSKCSTMSAHKGHYFTDLETIYTEKSAACREEIPKIQEHFMPTAKELQKDIEIEATEIKKIMDAIRSSMRDEAKSLKSLVDEVTSYNIEQVNEMEKSLREILQNQDKTYQDYISYLEDLTKKLHGYLNSTQLLNNPILSSISEHLKTPPIPETTKPVLPEFTPAQFSKKDVVKLLGKITVPNTKPENRKIKSTLTALTHSKPILKQKKPDSLSSSVTKVRGYTVPGVEGVHHVSVGKSDRLWVSDDKGNLIQLDLQGNQLQKIQTNGGSAGYHTVTQDEDLIYTDQIKNIINRITPGKTITEFIETKKWMPLCVHSSHINGDILVGTVYGNEGKVVRYSKTWKELQNIQGDNERQGLYRMPKYITENINGDICISDLLKEALVVVNKSGQHRFTYTGQGSTFYPKGVCTDLLGHIIVCDYNSNNVDLLNQDGQFLCLLLTKHQGVWSPYSVCVDDENNLLVGDYHTNKVTVYKYLQ
ncbi:E3 ubiquitin-protein ligase TRIM71-like isoform X2 [Crassostrea angulata]|uniref:E3 ubiquitin-protein ligase TRIM71-like isoform X2 n=1 Tax=Magallana angulata TaxID=2784310 RepID=UPI0022B0FB4F|nr:E3 ubiquitin-protein ligase TRIM71-like isoform X2 [Crassostrea angulata]